MVSFYMWLLCFQSLCNPNMSFIYHHRHILHPPGILLLIGSHSPPPKSKQRWWKASASFSSLTHHPSPPHADRQTPTPNSHPFSQNLRPHHVHKARLHLIHHGERDRSGQANLFGHGYKENFLATLCWTFLGTWIHGRYNYPCTFYTEEINGDGKSLAMGQDPQVCSENFENLYQRDLLEATMSMWISEDMILDLFHLEQVGEDA